MLSHWDDPFELLLVDEDTRFAAKLADMLKPAGFAVQITPDSQSAMESMQGDPPDFLVLGIGKESPLPVRHIHSWMNVLPNTRFVVILAESLESYEELLHQIGVHLIIPKRLTLRQIVQLITHQGELRFLEEQNFRLRQMLDNRMAYEDLIGGSPPMRALYRLIDQISRTDTPILITGEAGTERADVARAIHQKSTRSVYPVLVIDCAKESEDPTGATIFGPMGSGNYSTGPNPKNSAFARVGKGTIVFHQIETIPQVVQGRLLDFLHRPFFQNETPGTPRPLARIMATAGADLLREVESGKFQRELYYRLNILQVRIPPLRERREDIPILAQHFLRLATRNTPGGNAKSFSFSEDIMLHFFQYDWPGNVAELESLIQAMVQRAQGSQLDLCDLPDTVRRSNRKPDDFSMDRYAEMALKDAKRVFETEYFRQLLKRTHGNMTKASRQSRVGRPYLYKKIREYGIEPVGFRKS